MDRDEKIEVMRRLSADIRIETIRALAEAGFGHIGGCMSIADVLGVLYGGVMNIDANNPHWCERDWMVLSKGHCGPALYATLALKNYFPVDVLKSVNQPGTILPSHCDRLKTPGIDMSTGSLGQGISVASGIALANKLLKKSSYTYCIVGHGDLQEGQIWEAVQALSHLCLDHFILFVDYNKKQLDDCLEAINNPLDIGAKFKAFGFNPYTVCGYDAYSIYSAIESAKLTCDKPSVIILDTYKGAGCNFAEEAAFNHYMVISRDMANSAIEEIENRFSQGRVLGGDRTC